MAEYYVGFNSGSLCDFVHDFRYDEILLEEGLEVKDRYTDKGQEALDGWGFCCPTWFESSEVELLYPGDIDFEVDRFVNQGAIGDGEVSIGKWHPNFRKLMDTVHSYGPDYFDENQRSISKEDFEGKLDATSDYEIIICELDPPC